MKSDSVSPREQALHAALRDKVIECHIRPPRKRCALCRREWLMKYLETPAEPETHAPGCLAAPAAQQPPPVSDDAIAELMNIAHAKRFNREQFTDDTDWADWAQGRARHTLALLTAAAQQPPPPRELMFTLREATQLVGTFGGEDAMVTVRNLPAGAVKDDPNDPSYEGSSPAGLFAHFTEMPEEGCLYLGPCEVQDAAQQPVADAPLREPTQIGKMRCERCGTETTVNIYEARVRVADGRADALPRVPTPAMHEAAFDAGFHAEDPDDLITVWQAMYDAYLKEHDEHSR